MLPCMWRERKKRLPIVVSLRILVKITIHTKSHTFFSELDNLFFHGSAMLLSTSIYTKIYLPCNSDPSRSSSLSSLTFSFSPWLTWLNISFLSSWISFFHFYLKMPLGKLRSSSWVGHVFLLWGPYGTLGSYDFSVDLMTFKFLICFSTYLANFNVCLNL